jgi:hypothetical protein
MARRNRRSGRFSKSTRRTTRRTKSLSVLKVAEQLVVANAVTRGLFDTNLQTFIMPTSSNSKSWDNSWEITAPELINLVLGGTGGMAKEYDIQSAVKRNLRVNGWQTLATVVLAPIGFRMARKVLGKSIVNPANKMLKQVGVKEVKL